MSKLMLPFLIAGSLVLGGCATSRSVLDVQAPRSPQQAAPSNGKTVYVNVVSDQRVFEVSPTNPSIPSLDSSEAQDGNIKLRALGRKRNTFGQALGDIVLKEGQTVETLTAASIRQAFAAKGYRVLESKDKADATYVVDANIGKFWSWMNPGFSAITLSTEIQTDLTIKSANAANKQSVAVSASGSYQTGMEENWLEVINKALHEYVNQLKEKLN